MNMMYVTGCAGPCGDKRVAFDTPEPNQACWRCAPHVCVREWIEDDWCALCGRDL